MNQPPPDSNAKCRFTSSLLGVPAPAVLSHQPWLHDTAFVNALLGSWEEQYTDYLGADTAIELVKYLHDTGELFAHDASGSLLASMGTESVGVGALRCLKGVSLITMLEVLESYQGAGIGRQLIEALASCGDPLLAHVSIHRPHILEFYRSLGFIALSRTHIDHYGHSLLLDVMVRPAAAQPYR